MADIQEQIRTVLRVLFDEFYRKRGTVNNIAALHDYYEVIDEPPKCGKDMNDELIALL